MKKYINATLITTALITTALISTHTTHSMLSKRAAISTTAALHSSTTALRASIATLSAPTATRALCAPTARQTIARTLITGAPKQKTTRKAAIADRIGSTAYFRAFQKSYDKNNRRFHIFPTRIPLTKKGELKYPPFTQEEELNTMNQLLSSPDINATDEYNRTALMLAAKNNVIPTVKKLLADNALVNSVDTMGESALIKAAMLGHTQVIQMLLAGDGLVNNIDNFGRTALRWATQYNHIAAVEMLLAHKASPDLADGNGNTALLVAAGEGNTEILKILLAYKTSVHVANKQGNTALIWAAHYGRTAAVRMLLTDYVPFNHVDYVNKKGQTALLKAAEGTRSKHFLGSGGVVKMLLKYHASVTHTDNSGNTALLNAVLGGYTDVVQILLAADKTNINQANNEGRKPLDIAIYNRNTYCGNASVAKALIDAGADTKHLNKFDMEQLQEMLPEMKFE